MSGGFLYKDQAPDLSHHHGLLRILHDFIIPNADNAFSRLVSSSRCKLWTSTSTINAAL